MFIFFGRAEEEAGAGNVGIVLCMGYHSSSLFVYDDSARERVRLLFVRLLITAPPMLGIH